MKDDLYTFIRLEDRFLRQVADRLNSGGPLGELLASGIRSRRWILHAILPQGTTLSATQSLEEGGIASPKEPTGLIAHRIARCLSRAPIPIAIFENDVGRRGDEWIARYDRQLHFNGDRIYHIVESGEPESEILFVIRKAKSARLLVGMIASSPAERLETEIDHKQLRDLASNAVAIIVDAFDGETFVVAELDGAARVLSR